MFLSKIIIDSFVQVAGYHPKKVINRPSSAKTGQNADAIRVNSYAVRENAGNYG